MDEAGLYDLILMDIGMLERGYYSMIQSVREEEQKSGNPETLIILMPGRQDNWLKGKYSSYVNGAVGKPLSFERLDSLLKQTYILKELQKLERTRKMTNE